MNFGVMFRASLVRLSVEAFPSFILVYIVIFQVVQISSTLASNLLRRWQISSRPSSRAELNILKLSSHTIHTQTPTIINIHSGNCPPNREDTSQFSGLASFDYILTQVAYQSLSWLYPTFFATAFPVTHHLLCQDQQEPPKTYKSDFFQFFPL